MSRSTTVSAFAHWWLRNVAANRVRASSLGKYEDRVGRITARLGDVELGALRAEQVATMQTELLATLLRGVGARCGLAERGDDQTLRVRVQSAAAGTDACR